MTQQVSDSEHQRQILLMWAQRAASLHVKLLREKKKSSPATAVRGRLKADSANQF